MYTVKKVCSVQNAHFFFKILCECKIYCTVLNTDKFMRALFQISVDFQQKTISKNSLVWHFLPGEFNLKTFFKFKIYFKSQLSVKKQPQNNNNNNNKTVITYLCDNLYALSLIITWKGHKLFPNIIQNCQTREREKHIWPLTGTFSITVFFRDTMPSMSISHVLWWWPCEKHHHGSPPPFSSFITS